MRATVSILLLIFPLLSQAVDCVGYHEYIDEENHSVFQTIQLSAEYEDEQTLKLSGDLGHIHYMALLDKQKDSYLLMVTLGPSYMSGVTANLTWDHSDSMRISRVDVTKVYRLVCKKNQVLLNKSF